MKIERKKLFIFTALFIFFVGFSFKSNGLQENLTYDEAVKHGINFNLGIERQKDIIDKLDERLSTSRIYEQTGLGILENSVDYEDLTRSHKAEKEDLNAKKDALKLKIKEMFLKIENMETNLKILDEKISNKRKHLSCNTVEYKVGVSSKMDLDKSYLDLEDLLKEKEEIALSLKILYNDLENLTDIKNIKSIKYESVEFKPFNEYHISKDSLIGRVSSESVDILRKNNEIKTFEKKLKYGLLDDFNRFLPNDEEEINLRIKDVNLRLDKKTLKDKVIETLNSIDELEGNIKNAKENLRILERENENLKLKHKLGMAKDLDLQDNEILIKSAKLNIKNMITSHYTLIKKCEKPYLLSI